MKNKRDFNLQVGEFVDHYYLTDELMWFILLQMEMNCWDNAVCLARQLPSFAPAMLILVQLYIDKEKILVDEPDMRVRLEKAQALLAKLEAWSEQDGKIANELSSIYAQDDHLLTAYGYGLRAKRLGDPLPEQTMGRYEKLVRSFTKNQLMRELVGCRVCADEFRRIDDLGRAAFFAELAAEVDLDNGIAQFEAAEMLSAVGNHSGALTYYHRAKLLGCPTLLNRT